MQMTSQRAARSKESEGEDDQKLLLLDSGSLVESLLQRQTCKTGVEKRITWTPMSAECRILSRIMTANR